MQTLQVEDKVTVHWRGRFVTGVVKRVDEEKGYLCRIDIPGGQTTTWVKAEDVKPRATA